MESLRTTRQTDTKSRKKIKFNNSNNAISKEKSNNNKRIEAHTSRLVSKKIKLTHEHGINQDNNTINEENSMDNDGKNDVEEHVDNNEVTIEISKEEQLFNIQQRILNHKKTDTVTLNNNNDIANNHTAKGSDVFDIMPIGSIESMKSLIIVKTDNYNNTFNSESSSKNIMGIGHYSLLHAYVRDTLFKRIKLLSDDHLETNGEIMQKALEHVNYNVHYGNKIKFVNALRMEIRVTMNSRIGYVKRQIGINMKGNLLNQK